MAKKKQNFSSDNVDEMVERLKQSYENADHAEGEDADADADDEAFAKMLVEMFGNQGKDKPSATKKSNDLYSAEDFMPDDEDEADQEYIEDEPEEELEDEFEDELEEEFEEELEEELDQEIDEDVDEEYEIANPDEIAEQIREQAQNKIIEQFKQEQAIVESAPESEPEQILEDELPWFEDDELDEEDAREIAEYEALVAEDELEQLIGEDDDEDEEFIEDEEFVEDEKFIEDEELIDDEEFIEDEELIEDEEIIEDEELIEDEEIIEDEEFIEDEEIIEDKEITEDQEPAQEQPEPEEDYVDMVLGSLDEWRQSVAALKAQMRAEHSANIPAKPSIPVQEMLQESEPILENESIEADPLTDGAPEYPANDPMQGRVVKSEPSPGQATPAGVEFDEKDIHMMTALGYGQEVKTRVGSERVHNAVAARKQKRQAFGTDNPLCFAWRGKEYMDAADEAEIKQAYGREKPRVIVRLAVCIVFLFSLIALDNAYLLGYLQGSVPRIISTPLYPLLAVLSVCVVMACSWRRLFEGLRSIWSPGHNLYSVPALMLSASLLYDIVLVFLAGKHYMMFNSLAVFALTLCTVADVLNLYHQERNFRVVRSGKPRYGIEKVSDATNGSRLPVTDREIRKPHAGAYRVRKIGHLSGYFRRTGAVTERGISLSVVYGVLFVCAVAAAVATLIATGQGMDALTAFMVCINAAMPLSMLLFGAVSAFVAGKTLLKSGCAVIGDGAAEEYKDVKALLFDAGQMFCAYGSSQITVRGDSDIGTYMDKTRVLLRALGGTLADIAGEGQEDDAPVKIEIMSVGEDGMTLYMDGVTCVMMGDYDYLAGRGVRLPRRELETNYKKRKNSSVIYLAFDGVFRVGYSVDYELRREFLLRAKQLKAEGIDPVIVTYDPCINQETVNTRAKGSGITVERQRDYEGAAGETVLDCGVIATRAPEDVLLPLLACRKLRRVRMIGMIWRFAYLALSAALVVLLSVLGCIWYAWPLLLLLYQALWLVAIPIVCTCLLGDLRKTK